jgi:acyl-CoA thioester hydrolase
MYRTRIYYQDTDAGGVVYFANYLKLFEKSWFTFLDAMGNSLPEWEKQGVYVMVRNATLDLIESLRYSDDIEVHSSVSAVKHAQFTLLHEVSKDGRVTTKGSTLMVCVNATGKPRRLPEEFKRRLLEAGSSNDHSERSMINPKS